MISCNKTWIMKDCYQGSVGECDSCKKFHSHRSFHAIIHKKCIVLIKFLLENDILLRNKLSQSWYNGTTHDIWIVLNRILFQYITHWDRKLLHWWHYTIWKWKMNSSYQDYIRECAYIKKESFKIDDNIQQHMTNESFLARFC